MSDTPASDALRDAARERKRAYRKTDDYRQWREQRGKARYRERWSERGIADVERRTNYQMLKRFGISLAEYSVLLEKQDGKCAICGRDASEFARKLCVDHCHISGKVRGLLCFFCNTAIGKFGDDPQLLEVAAAYLRASACPLTPSH